MYDRDGTGPRHHVREPEDFRRAYCPTPAQAPLITTTCSCSAVTTEGENSLGSHASPGCESCTGFHKLTAARAADYDKTRSTQPGAHYSLGLLPRDAVLRPFMPKILAAAPAQHSATLSTANLNRSGFLNGMTGLATAGSTHNLATLRTTLGLLGQLRFRLRTQYHRQHSSFKG